MREFAAIQELSKIDQIKSLKMIHYMCRLFFEKKQYDQLASFILLFHEKKDVNELKTILIIGVAFKNHLKLQWVLFKTKEIFDDQIEKLNGKQKSLGEKS